MSRVNGENISRRLSNGNRAQTRNRNPFNDMGSEEDDYESDEFRMFSFKIKNCYMHRPHDWTVCPYAHPGERARRRDPLKLPYVAIACPDYQETRGLSCPRGELCDFAHGVFEYWLHPTKYRTRMCHGGIHCSRSVCFFAHSPDQLRVGCMSQLPKWLRLALREKLNKYHASEPLSSTSAAIDPNSNTSDGPGLGVIGQTVHTPTPRFTDIPNTSTNICVATEDEELQELLNLDFLDSPKMSSEPSSDYFNSNNLRMSDPSSDYYNNIPRMPGYSNDYLYNNQLTVQTDIVSQPDVEFFEGLRISGSSSDFYNNQVMAQDDGVNRANVESDEPNFDWVSDLLTG